MNIGFDALMLGMTLTLWGFLLGITYSEWRERRHIDDELLLFWQTYTHDDDAEFEAELAELSDETDYRRDEDDCAE